MGSKKATKNWREKNKDKVKEYARRWREKNKDYTKNWREKNKDKVKEYIKNNAKNWEEKNKDKVKEYRKNKIKEYRANYTEEKKQQISLQKKLYREKNKEKLAKIQKEWYDNEIKNNPFFKLKANIRTLIGNSFRRNGYKKSSKTEQILGCTYDEFKLHLEKQFEVWMNWENRGLYNGTENYGWDIDHIIPLSTATCEADVIRLNHYTNLQPLCSHYNRDIKK